MKRFTTTLALLLMIAMPMMAERVTPETARKAASNFLNNNGAKSVQLTDLSKAAGFPNLYIFTAEQGFVVMAADDCVQPILGYSLTGKFVAENMPTNVSGWLQGYSDEIQFAIDSKAKATAETAKQWKDLIDGNSKAAKATVVVDALIQTTWDQDPGYNALCPYDSNAGELTVTGCAATAMAQIIRYWEYPSHGVGSHSYTPSSHPEYGVQSVNFAQATYDWTDMPLYSPNSEIAKLMYHCGVAVDMDYNISSNGGSSAFNTSIAPALTNYFNYKSTASLKWKNSYSGNWIDLIKTELDAGRPIEYNGSGSGGGHAFVCDGYDNNNYFHFNWGWSGRNDGFFSLSNLNPGSGGSGGGSYNFTNNQNAVIGIQPKDCTSSTPTNFSVSKEDRNAYLTWSEADNAVSYYVYRNGLLVASTSSTTYTDENLLYGTYAYYVKSVDSNGAKSSPTTTITIAIEPVATNLTITQSGDGAILNWVEPEWCAPSTDDEVLTYSYGNTIYHFGSGGTSKLYYGHKYPSSMINPNKVLYKVSFYPTMTGAYTLCVYNANAGNSKPQTQVYTQDITVSGTGWNDIVLNTPLQLDATKDLWVFIYDPVGRNYPMGAGEYVGTDSNGNYVSTSTPTSSVSVQSVVMLINTYITDGAFTYNLYDGTTTIASNISNTTYTINNIAGNTAHQYTLKTNFSGGLTEASNMAGLTLGTASLNSLQMAANDQMTITEGSQLTVSGTMSNDNAANLIIENGAQLVHNSEGVKATVKKEIAKYTVQGDDENLSNGWYLLASPMMENIEASTGNGLLANDYDLYYFDQSEEKEWRNHKIKAFELENGKGYLYANSEGTTLSFAGTLAVTATATDLAYDENAELKGFNLIGNPFACNATVERDFYVMNESMNEVTLAGSGRQIAPCEGIFVQASAKSETASFQKATSAKNSVANPSLDLIVTQGKTTLDRARVRLGDAQGLEKISIGKNSAKLYIPIDGHRFAVTYINQDIALNVSTKELPLNFMAAENGTYSISIEANSLDLDYLHLIDNMTGDDIDLLATPSYTFEAKTTDYASRFRLVFNADDASTGSGAFAFISNGNIIVNGEGTLQVIDVTGRVILSGDAMNRVSTNGMTAGVYVLRLIDGDNVRTQKIVIE